MKRKERIIYKYLEYFEEDSEWKELICEECAACNEWETGCPCDGNVFDDACMYHNKAFDVYDIIKKAFKEAEEWL